MAKNRKMIEEELSIEEEVERDIRKLEASRVDGPDRLLAYSSSNQFRTKLRNV
jgi:hypothetical protein